MKPSFKQAPADRARACERFTNDLLVEFGYDLSEDIDLDEFRDWILELRNFAGKKTCEGLIALRREAGRK